MVASSIVEGDEFVAIEGGPARADAALDVPRAGPAPRLSSFESVAAHDLALVSQVRSLIEAGIYPGNIGVPTATNLDADAISKALRAYGFGVIELESYTGSPRR